MNTFLHIQLTLLCILVSSNQIRGANICREKLGMEDGRIKNNEITASSVHANAANHGPTNARLNRVPVSGTVGGWVAGARNTNQWIQAELKVKATVVGIILQGRHGSSQYVTKFKVEYSNDGNDWEFVKAIDQQDKIFDGNTDGSTAVTRLFSQPVNAHFIKIRPTAWNSYISVRFELLGCYIGSCRNRQYIISKDFRLQNHVIGTKTTRNYLICERMCNSETSCKSFNWNQKTKTCETSSTTNEANPSDMTSSTGWTFYRKEVSDVQCDKSLCPAGQTCNTQCHRNAGLNLFCRDSTLAYKYLGCFIDLDGDRTVNNHVINSPTMTIEICMDHCRSHDLPYAALQASDWCHCGGSETEYDKHGQAPESECGSNCKGNSEQKCGGAWRNSVYKS